jgi:hypothetical protein
VERSTRWTNWLRWEEEEEEEEEEELLVWGGGGRVGGLVVS